MSASRDREKWLAVFDRRLVGGCNAHETPRSHAMNGRPNSERFDITQLPVGVEGLAFARCRTAQMKYSDQIGLDRIEPKPRRIGNGSIVHATRLVCVPLSAAYLDLVVSTHDPYAHYVAAAQKIRQRAHA